jgi:hypothetical protein
MVEITLVRELIERILPFRLSAKIRTVELKLAPWACFGLEREADVAGPPSPLNPLKEDVEPAYEVINPFTAETLRILFPAVSEINKAPNLSPHTACGSFKDAEVAGPPSPVELASPVPTAVLMHEIVGEVVGLFEGTGTAIKYGNVEKTTSKTAIHSSPRVNNEERNKPVL